MLKQKHEKVKAREMKNDNINGYNVEIETVKFFSEDENFAAYISLPFCVILLSLVIFITKFC